jgi:hypothetical protein
LKTWSTVWMQTETKKTPTITSQTISPNKTLLSLSIYFPLSFYHFTLSDISPFIPKTRYWLILGRVRPLLRRSQGYDVDWAFISSHYLFFSLFYYKAKVTLEKQTKDSIIKHGLCLCLFSFSLCFSLCWFLSYITKTKVNNKCLIFTRHGTRVVHV